MTPQEIQRTMDFILRSQADAVIRSGEQREKIDDLIVAVREAAKAIHDAAKLSLAQEKRIRTLERSERRTRTRVDSMRDVMKILTRLVAVESKRLSQLEKNG